MSLSSDSPLLELAVRILSGGGLVALPTETVYGLGADARNARAVARIFEVKGRPKDHPLIVHLAEAQMLDAWARDVPAAARDLAAAFWPGPLTLVLRRRDDVPDLVAGGHPTIALRVPAHPLALAVLRRFGGGIAAPSANRFGQVSPTTAAHVRADLGDDVDLVLDGGPCGIGVESTIVDLSGGAPRILRPGGLSAETLREALGRAVTTAGEGSAAPAAPGRLPSHYAPRATLELFGSREQLEQRARSLAVEGRRPGVLADRPVLVADGSMLPFARLPAEPTNAARGLYGALRALDDAGCEIILAEEIVADGLGAAVNDRLRKAAAPRG